MYLRDLALYASDASDLRPPFDARAFHAGALAPVEAFLALLPRRKVFLGDLAKVNVVVGPRTAGTPMVFSAMHVAIVAWPWFDLARYAALDRAGRQRRIAGVLRRSLVRLARRTDSPTH